MRIVANQREISEPKIVNVLYRRIQFHLRKRARLAAETVMPIDDVRASARYRKLLVGTLVERALTACADRIGKAGA